MAPADRSPLAERPDHTRSEEIEAPRVILEVESFHSRPRGPVGAAAQRPSTPRCHTPCRAGGRCHRITSMSREHVIFLAFADARGDLPELRGDPAAPGDLRGGRERRATARWCSSPTPRSTRSSTSSPERRPGRRSSTTGATPTRAGCSWSRACAAGPRIRRRAWRRSWASSGACNWSSSTAARPAPRSRGCSMRGSPAVIATARAIDDRVARDFAVAFYRALTTGGDGPRTAA